MNKRLHLMLAAVLFATIACQKFALTSIKTFAVAYRLAKTEIRKWDRLIRRQILTDFSLKQEAVKTSFVLFKFQLKGA